MTCNRSGVSQREETEMLRVLSQLAEAKVLLEGDGLKARADTGPS